jgi:hypothetical protein
VLVVVVIVLVVAVFAVDVVEVLRVRNRRVAATGPVDVHVARVEFMDLVRAIRAVLDQGAGPMMEMPVVQKVAVVSVTDDRMAAGFVVIVRVIGLAARARCHGHMICLLSNRLRPRRPKAVAA